MVATNKKGAANAAPFVVSLEPVMAGQQAREAGAARPGHQTE
jgi:hypothetical protein